MPRTAYTCPVLMELSRRREDGFEWKQDEEGIWYVSNGRWHLPCAFPNWLILLECRFWNSWAGRWLR